MNSKIKIITAILVIFIIIGGLFFIGKSGFSILSGLRAYVGGEGLWAKSNKEATYQLIQYVFTGEANRYQSFIDSLKIPIGDKAARLELETSDPVDEIVLQGFRDGGNHPADIPTMILLYKYFKNVGSVGKAIEQWEIGDGLIEELLEIGEQTKSKFADNSMSKEQTVQTLASIDVLQKRLNDAEDLFSYNMSAAARWTANLLFVIMLLFTLVGSVLCFIMLRLVVGIISDLNHKKKQLENQAQQESSLKKELQESEKKYRAMMEATQDAIYICSPNFKIEYMNSAMIRQVGRDATGEYCFSGLHGMEEKCSWCMHHRAQQGEHYEQTIISPRDNRFYHVSNSPIIHSRDGSISKLAVFRDITELKLSEKMLKDSENKFKSFAEQSLVGINLIQDGVFQYVNPKFAEIFGYTVEECLDDMPFRKLVYPEDLPIVEEQVKKRIEGGVKSVHYTFRGLKKDGEIIYVEIFGSTIVIEDKPVVVATILDITKRKHTEAELEQAKKEALEMANKDALTGLLNRRAFMERMEQEIQRSLRGNTPLSFMLIDIDHFKDVNDRYGHQVGDMVLQRFSNKLATSIRPYDLLGRYGGEEFVICLLGTDRLKAASIAEKMRQQIEEMEVIVPGSLQSVCITASFGTAQYEMGSRGNVELLIKWADDALYRAKKEGRNRVCKAVEG